MNIRFRCCYIDKDGIHKTYTSVMEKEELEEIIYSELQNEGRTVTSVTIEEVRA